MSWQASYTDDIWTEDVIAFGSTQKLDTKAFDAAAASHLMAVVCKAFLKNCFAYFTRMRNNT